MNYLSDEEVAARIIQTAGMITAEGGGDVKFIKKGDKCNDERKRVRQDHTEVRKRN